MAQEVKVLLVDDLDGGEAHGTIQIGVNGAWREIDLSDVHEKEFFEAVSPFWENARNVVGQVKTRRARSTSATATEVRRPARDTSGVQSKARAWAHANGVAVNDRGRVSAEVVEAYKASLAPAEAVFEDQEVLATS